MSLLTGTPAGSITSTEEIYISKAPYIYFQDYSASPWYAPDEDGFYWQLSGTSAYKVFHIGCPLDVSLASNITMNEMRCDNVGVKDTAQQLNYVDFIFTIQSMFPYSVLRNILHGGIVTENASTYTHKFGIGAINNNQFWMVYAPVVYDEDTGDYIAIQLHKAKFVDNWTINMTFGTNWQIQGIKMRAFADTTKPSAQQFMTWIRLDPSVIT
jgi:hypothetical protein